MSEPDFAYAGEEFASTPWLAHLAGGAAAASGATAWALLVFVAPGYLQPYGEQAIALEALPQAVLQLSVALQGAAGWIGLALFLAVAFAGWRLARTRGGAFTAGLFTLAGLALVLAIVVVLACGSPGHFAQDLLQPR